MPGDLNPVAVLINKAMIEIPPKFAGKPPVNPVAWSKRDLISREWCGAQGLAEDVRYYGQRMRDEAERRIGHLYPKVEVTTEMAKGRPDLKSTVGKKLTVIAWLWARTVKSPNPAFAHVDVPLASTFMLSTKVGKEVYVQPSSQGERYRSRVKIGIPKDPEAAKRGTKSGEWQQHFLCLLSGTPMPFEYIRSEKPRLVAWARGSWPLLPRESRAESISHQMRKWKLLHAKQGQSLLRMKSWKENVG